MNYISGCKLCKKQINVYESFINFTNNYCVHIAGAWVSTQLVKLQNHSVFKPIRTKFLRVTSSFTTVE